MKPNKILKSLRKPISLFTFSCIVSIGTLLFYNIPFFNYVADNSNGSVGGKIFLLTSLVVLMLALNFMMTYLVMFLTRIVGRILLAILSIINATAVYFVFTYSVMIDATTIENVFNTRYSEASGFFTWSLWLFIFVFGVLPALYCLFQPIVFGKVKKLGIYCGSSLAIVLVVALMNFNQTLFVSQHDTELGGLLQPWSYIANTCRIISFSHDENAEEIKLPDGKIADNGGSNMPGVDAGFYMITVNLNEMTYSTTPITNISIIGGFNDWAGDVEMTYNVEGGYWECTTGEVSGEYKFRANHDWAINWGGTEDNLTQDGANLNSDGGTHTYKLYLSCENKHHVVIE
jgi:hypothetical protein